VLLGNLTDAMAENADFNGQIPDPFTARMIFLRVGWMDRYQGVVGGDTIHGGGAYVAKHGFGPEIFNFQPFQKAVYGYVQPPSRKGQWENGRIDLTRLGAAADDKSLSNVLAVWVATSPLGGAFIVGWYKNATIYRNWQSSPPGSARRHSDTDCGYFVTASAEDSVLLPPDERVFPIPQQGKGEFGQSNIWYADDPAQHRQLRLNVLEYVESSQLPNAARPETSSPRQSDPLLRQQVEQIAVKTTEDYFTGLGYRVNSVEQDNVGWDLNAVLGNRDLKLEVKGLSGSQIVVELTPNEYAAMKAYLESYRVCVVTDALTEPCLEVFAYSLDSRRWESPGRRILSIQEIKAARCSVT
jgi:hypothetical protein